MNDTVTFMAPATPDVHAPSEGAMARLEQRFAQATTLPGPALWPALVLVGGAMAFLTLSTFQSHDFNLGADVFICLWSGSLVFASVRRVRSGSRHARVYSALGWLFSVVTLWHALRFFHGGLPL